MVMKDSLGIRRVSSTSFSFSGFEDDSESLVSQTKILSWISLWDSWENSILVSFSIFYSVVDQPTFQMRITFVDNMHQTYQILLFMYDNFLHSYLLPAYEFKYNAAMHSLVLVESSFGKLLSESTLFVGESGDL
jgi:hypothetical protein